MPLATVTSKGQVTIPKEVRDRLGIRTGDQLEFQVGADGRMTVVPKVTEIKSLFGILAGRRRRPATLEEMDRAVRRAAVRRHRRSGA